MPVLLFPRTALRRRIDQQRRIVRGVDTCPAGPYGPTLLLNDAGVGAIAWTTPANARLSDDVYASATTVAQDTQRLNTTGYNFQIDPTRQIDGITVEVEASVLVGTATVYCRIIKAGVVSTTRISGTWTTTEGFVQYGNATTLWGETWTPDNVNAQDFGVSIRQEDALTSTLSCDSVRITVACSVPISGIKAGTLMLMGIGR